MLQSGEFIPILAFLEAFATVPSVAERSVTNGGEFDWTNTKKGL